MNRGFIVKHDDIGLFGFKILDNQKRVILHPYKQITRLL